MLQQPLLLELYTLSHHTSYTTYTTKAFSLNSLYRHCNYQHVKHYYHERDQYQSQQFPGTVLTL